MFGTELVTRIRQVPSGPPDPYSREPSLVEERIDLWTSEPPAPRASADDVRPERTASSDGWTVMFPNGTDVRREDRIEVRGIEYDIDGTPADWPGEDLLVQLVRSEG